MLLTGILPPLNSSHLQWRAILDHGKKVEDRENLVQTFIKNLLIVGSNSGYLSLLDRKIKFRLGYPG